MRPAKELAIEDFQVSVGVLKNEIFSISLSGAINRWTYSADIPDGALPVVSVQGHQSSVRNLLYNSLEKVLISADTAGRISNFFLEFSELRKKIVIWKNQIAHLPQGKGHAKTIVKIAHSADQKLVYSISFDGYLKCLNVNEMKYM